MALKFAKTKIKEKAKEKQLYSYTTAKNAIRNDTKHSGILGEIIHISHILQPLSEDDNKALDRIKTKDLEFIVKQHKSSTHSFEKDFQTLKSISEHWEKIPKETNQTGQSNTINIQQHLNECTSSIEVAYKDFYKVIEQNIPTPAPIKFLQSLKNKIFPKKIPTDALNTSLDAAYKDLRDKISESEVDNSTLQDWFNMKCLSISFKDLAEKLDAFKTKTNTGYVVLFASLSVLSFSCTAANVLSLNVVSTLISTLIMAWCIKHIDKNYKNVPKDPKKVKIDTKNKNLQNATKDTLS